MPIKNMFSLRGFAWGIFSGLVYRNMMNQFSANPVLDAYKRLALTMEDRMPSVSISYPQLSFLEQQQLSQIPDAEETGEEDQCTEREIARQTERVCDYFAGRHNLKPFFHLIRYHLPDANLFVDVGANKGLVSARWLELWRPELNITSQKYARQVAQPYFMENNQPAGHMDICGVTDMCDTISNAQMEAIMVVSPISPATFKIRAQQTQQEQGEAAPKTSDITKKETKSYQKRNRRPEFQVHSFEPSDPLFMMHHNYQTSAACSDEVRRIWKWHRIAASDSVGRVFIPPQFNEGASINKKGYESSQPNTQLATLDSLAYGSTKMFDGYHQTQQSQQPRIIDVLKIDAESVDAKVVAGAARLLKERRIRVIMWETPNAFPISTIPDWFFGGESRSTTTINSFCDLIAALDTHADMSCYFPLLQQKMAKLTGTGCCEPLTNAKRPRCTKKKLAASAVDMSNAACVSRTLAPTLYRAMEAQSLIY